MVLVVPLFHTSLSHLSSTFTGKLWWVFCAKDNLGLILCALNSKISSMPLLLYLFHHLSDSHTLKCMLDVLEHIDRNISLCARSGALPFLGKNWTFRSKLADRALGTSLLDHSSLRIKDLVHQDFWNFPLLNTILLEYYSNFLTSSLSCLSNGTDEYKWLLDPSG